jgi:hypothetical protein
MVSCDASFVSVSFSSFPKTLRVFASHPLMHFAGTRKHPEADCAGEQ